MADEPHQPPTPAQLDRLWEIALDLAKHGSRAFDRRAGRRIPDILDGED